VVQLRTAAGDVSLFLQPSYAAAAVPSPSSRGTEGDAQDTSEFHRKLLDCLAACFADVPELKKDATRAKKVKKAGGCCDS